jgi:hypothetical protein
VAALTAFEQLTYFNEIDFGGGHIMEPIQNEM